MDRYLCTRILYRSSPNHQILASSYPPAKPSGWTKVRGRSVEIVRLRGTQTGLNVRSGTNMAFVAVGRATALPV